MPNNHYGEEWILVGLSSQNSMLVRCGVDPIAIPVHHNNSYHLLELIADANAGIVARRADAAKK